MNFKNKAIFDYIAVTQLTLNPIHMFDVCKYDKLIFRFCVECFNLQCVPFKQSAK